MKPVPRTFSPSLFAACLGLGALLAAPAQSRALLLTASSSDATIAFNNPANPTDGGGTVQDLTGDVQSGRNGGNNDYYSSVFVFQLPSLGATANPFISASLSLTIRNTNSVDAFNGGLNRDLYGLGTRASATVLGSDFYLGGGDTTDATLVQGSFITGSNTPRFSGDVTRTTTGSDLLTYLNAQYNNGAGAGKYAFLRLSINGLNGNLDSLSVYSADSTANAAFLPQINYTAVPEPGSMTPFLCAGCLVITLAGRQRLLRAQTA